MGISFARPRHAREHRRAEKRYSVAGLGATTNIDLNEMGGGVMPWFTEDVDSNELTDEAVRSSLVTFDSFVNKYWPHFPENLTKRLGM